MIDPSSIHNRQIAARADHEKAEHALFERILAAHAQADRAADRAARVERDTLAEIAARRTTAGILPAGLGNATPLLDRCRLAWLPADASSD